MLLLQRALFLALAGMLLLASSLALTVRPAAAQTVAATVSLSCSGGWPSVGGCTVIPNFDVPPGGSFTVTMPDGSTATVSCPNGCAAGTPYTLTPATATAYSTYATPQTVYPGGACVGGSYPSAYGCTSATVSFVPVYSPPVYAPPVYSPPLYITPVSGFPFFPHHFGCLTGNTGQHHGHHDHDQDTGGMTTGTWSGRSC